MIRPDSYQVRIDSLHMSEDLKVIDDWMDWAQEHIEDLQEEIRVLAGRLEEKDDTIDVLRQRLNGFGE